MLSRDSSDVLSSFSGCVTIFLTALFGFLVLRFFLNNRRKNLPPGPTGLPFVGYYPFLTKTPYRKLRDLSEIYGDVMLLNIVGTPVVHLGSYDAIREAFINQGNEFAGRPQGFSFFMWMNNNCGIAQLEGDEWKEHQRFTLHTLREFGFGKISLEGRIQHVSEDLMLFLKQSKGNPSDLREIVTNSTCNVLCSLLFDRHFKSDDPVFQKIKECTISLFTNLPGTSAFLNGPLVKYLPISCVPGGKRLIDIKNDFRDVLMNLIKEHQDAFDPTFLRDYVDAYVNEMKKIESFGLTESSSFTIDRLPYILQNFFFGGVQTTAATLLWAMAILMTRPEIQRKIRSEIEEVVGKDRYPSINDKSRMPYTEATINEIFRFSNISSLSVVRSNPEEVTFRNFTIPKRSVIIPNLWAIHDDPKYWPEPDKFDPLRFLNHEGKLVKRDGFIPFSAGKRICTGENLARIEIFIFLTSILQRFELSPPPNDQPQLEIVDNSLLRILKPFKICVKEILL